MRIHNNNREVERELARAYYQENRSGNRVMLLTISMAVFLLYSVFSIAYGKIRSDYLIDVRGMGTLAEASLENGTSRQYGQIKELPYISAAGIKKTVMRGRYEDLWSGSLVFLDDTAYERMMRPAYTDVEGAYPHEEDEIMLPVRCLYQMGIETPALGMEIKMLLELPKEREETFYLSGYYTDYVDSAVCEPEGYISEAFLKKWDLQAFPADKIMMIQNTPEEGLEQRLYSDIEMEYDSQQIFGENPMVLQSVEGVFGSVSIALGCGMAVILCAFMMIYNVAAISMENHIRQYGLLKVIGTTNAQLRRIVYKQRMWSTAEGLCIGGAAGGIFIKILLPGILQKLFMQGLGKSDVTGFYPQYLLAAGAVIAAVSFAADGMALRRVIKWNPLDSIRYAGMELPYKEKKGKMELFYKKKKMKSPGEINIPKLAWRYIGSWKKRLVISAVSLILGSITAMGAWVIMTGTDIRNEFRDKPDFQIGILAGIFRFPEKVPGEINDDTEVLAQDVVDRILSLDGVDQRTVFEVRGSYAVIDLGRDEALEPRKKSLEDMESDTSFATLQIVDQDYVDQLEQYVLENHLQIRMDILKNGTGCILLHHHEMSQILSEQTEETLGLPIHFYSLSARQERECLERAEKGSLSCAGYLDVTEKYFPKLQTTSTGNRVSYFIMTEEAFKKLGFSEKIFDISFDAEDEKKIPLNQKLTQFVQKENQRSGVMDTFYLSENYTLLETEKNRINTANILLGALSGVILMIGIMNYCNTLITGFHVRKRELVILESVGMTRKQLRSMLFLEGLYYWSGIMAGLLTVGSGAVWLLGKSIQKKLLYFRLIYPWKIVAGLAAVLFLTAWILSRVIYLKSLNKDIDTYVRE